jgi:hypothetical protein
MTSTEIEHLNKNLKLAKYSEVFLENLNTYFRNQIKKMQV